MNVITKTIINRPIESVWNVMGVQFAEVDQWSSNFLTSQPGGDATFEGLDYSERITTTERGETVQQLTAFDPAGRSLSYQITKGAPEIAKEARSTWALKEVNSEQTEVILEFILEPKVELNEYMEAKIKAGLTASSSLIAEELKFFLETGQPHSNKVAQQTN